ncbi:SHOCT domain-containing protein [Nonomuraea sp. NPDC049421]|uniref:SHOCT domain-containing protein n=1 Tax=Nonomuraea sp. NPDC049421 TaxID=3155275 RepID=UPI00344145DF
MHTIVMSAPHWGPAAGFWPIFPLAWGLLWVAVIALAVTGFRKGWWGPRRAAAATPGATPGAPTEPTATAERILAERYARGEMTDDEYFEKMSVLRGGAA